MEWAWGALERAEAQLAHDPRGAATEAARLLRAYSDRRYGTDIRGATTGELDAGEPVWFLRSRWSEFLRILHVFDAARFPVRDEDPGSGDGVARIREALESARDFVADRRGGG